MPLRQPTAAPGCKRGSSRRGPGSGQRGGWGCSSPVLGVERRGQDGQDEAGRLEVDAGAGQRVVFGGGWTFWPGTFWVLWLGAGPGACGGRAVAASSGESCVEWSGRQNRSLLPGPGAQSSALSGLLLLPCPVRLPALGPPSGSVRRLLSGLHQGPTRARLWPVAQPGCPDGAGQWPWGHPRPLSWPAPLGHAASHTPRTCALTRQSDGRRRRLWLPDPTMGLWWHRLGCRSGAR